MRASSRDLNGIDDEVLAQDRLVNLVSYLIKISEIAVETVGLCQHTDRCSVARVGTSQEARRICALDNCAQSRRCRLALHDDCRAAGTRLEAYLFVITTRAQCVLKRARRARKRQRIDVPVGLVKFRKTRPTLSDDRIKDGPGFAQSRGNGRERRLVHWFSCSFNSRAVETMVSRWEATAPLES